MKRVLTILLLLFTALLPLTGCAGAAQAGAVQRDDDIVEISFEFNKQSGYASNQFAVWIEDADGALVKTVFVTKFAANGGYEKRPDAVPTWVERTGAANRAASDATSGATPKTGTLRYVWDLTDESGARVPNGTYRFYVEGTLRWKNRVLFSGEIEINDKETSAEATAEYTYLDSQEQSALTDESVEHNMIQNVWATYIPKEQS